MPMDPLFTDPGASLLRDPRDERIRGLPESPDHALVGVPWDWSVSGRPGARMAPGLIRRYFYSLATYSPSYGRLPYRPRDLGDVAVAPGLYGETARRVREAASMVFRGYRHGFFLGGDHSITEWIVEGLAGNAGRIGILLLDAHYDMRSVEGGVTSGSWLWNLSEKLGARLAVAIIGVGDYANPPYLHERASSAGYHVVSAGEAMGDPLQAVEAIDWLEDQGADAYYISLDMDVVDQAYAPGVNSPNPLGLTPWDVVFILDEAIPRLCPRGVDIVEVSPPYDRGDATSRLAAVLLAKMVHLVMGCAGE